MFLGLGFHLKDSSIAQHGFAIGVPRCVNSQHSRPPSSKLPKSISTILRVKRTERLRPSRLASDSNSLAQEADFIAKIELATGILRGRHPPSANSKSQSG